MGRGAGAMANEGETMKADKQGFSIELENYAYGVEKIIPFVPTRTHEEDDSFGDEMTALLFARDWLEDELLAHPKVYAASTNRLRKLDTVLRAKRDAVLKLIPNFSEWREHHRVKPPQSHWWWYLDQLNGEPEIAQEVVAIAPNRVGVLFDRAVANQVGLKPGQRVRVNAIDGKHLIISVK